MKYDNLKDGQWVEPVLRGYRICCCDCGLIHDVDFKMRGSSVLFRVNRNARATAASRRKKS